MAKKRATQKPKQRNTANARGHVVRKMMSKDYARVIEIEDEGSDGNEEFDEADLYIIGRCKGVVGYVVHGDIETAERERGLIVGYAIAERVDEDVVRIAKMRISDEHCGKGFGTSLVEGLTERLPENWKPDTLLITVNERSTGFLTFLSRKGFISCGLDRQNETIDMVCTIEREARKE